MRTGSPPRAAAPLEDTLLHPEPSSRCPHCGARAGPGPTCEYCGGPLPRHEAAPSAVERAERARAEDPPAGELDPDRRARFRALQEHPRTADLLAGDPPSPAARRPRRAGPILLLVLLAILGVRAAREDGLAPARLALLAGAGLVALWLLRRPGRSAPTPRAQGFPVRVAEDRSSDFAERDRGYLRAALVLEHPDGRRQRVEGSARRAGTPRVDEMGVAYLIGDEIVGFVRIPV